MRHGLTSKWWATFNQWRDLGGRVMRRPDDVPPWAWGTGIIYWSKTTKVEENDHGEEEEKDVLFLRTYTVFNVDQVEGNHLDHLRVGHSVIENRTPGRVSQRRPTSGCIRCSWVSANGCRLMFGSSSGPGWKQFCLPPGGPLNTR